MGGQQSHVNKSNRMNSFHVDKYAGTWYTVSGNRMKLCHHWDGNNKRMKISFKNLESLSRRSEIATVDPNRIGNLLLASNSTYVVHWTDYHHYSFVTLDGDLYVLSREKSLRACEVELVSMALKGCDLHTSLVYIVDENNVQEKQDMLEKSDFWSEVGKNSYNKNTYDSKFSR